VVLHWSAAATAADVRASTPASKATAEGGAILDAC
jgi:hypothetical protein